MLKVVERYVAATDILGTDYSVPKATIPAALQDLEIELRDAMADVYY